MLTNCPPFPSETADHNVVYFYISTKACIIKQPPRTVYLYHKTDLPAAKEAATALSEKISQKADHTDVQPLWDEFHSGMEDLIKAHVPSKVVKGNRPQPWFNK
jgi:hypothetical protein